MTHVSSHTPADRSPTQFGRKTRAKDRPNLVVRRSERRARRANHAA